VSIKELQEHAAKMENGHSRDVIAARLGRSDVNKNDVITYKEFMDMVRVFFPTTYMY
jgi:hypothetical protein